MKEAHARIKRELTGSHSSDDQNDQVDEFHAGTFLSCFFHWPRDEVLTGDAIDPAPHHLATSSGVARQKLPVDPETRQAGHLATSTSTGNEDAQEQEETPAKSVVATDRNTNEEEEEEQEEEERRSQEGEMKKSAELPASSPDDDANRDTLHAEANQHVDDDKNAAIENPPSATHQPEAVQEEEEEEHEAEHAVDVVVVVVEGDEDTVLY